MLVLTRKPLSSIQIGSNITVTVVSINKHRVKLGIEAPNNIRVVRDELLSAEDKPGPVVLREPQAAPCCEHELCG
jgi:carbon storage regulator